MHRRWPRASMMCRRFIVSGRVQGVYFRQSTQAESLRLGLTGYVRNLPDGSVEVIACGDPEPLAALEDWLWHGPPLARVDLVTITDIERESHPRFEIRR